MNETRDKLCAKITQYLEVGGLFNPELMDSEKVRDVLMECREALLKLPSDERVGGRT